MMDLSALFENSKKETVKEDDMATGGKAPIFILK